MFTKSFVLSGISPSFVAISSNWLQILRFQVRFMSTWKWRKGLMKCFATVTFCLSRTHRNNLPMGHFYGEEIEVPSTAFVYIAVALYLI